MEREAVYDAAGDGEELAFFVAEAFEDEVGGEAEGPVAGALEVNAGAESDERRGVVAVEANAGEAVAGVLSGGAAYVAGASALGAIVEDAHGDAAVGVGSESRMLVVEPAVLHAEERIVHEDERAVDAIDDGVAIDFGGAGAAAVLGGCAPFFVEPVGAGDLGAAEVHAVGQVLAGLEVEVVEAAVELPLVVIGDGCGRTDALGRGADRGDRGEGGDERESEDGDP